MHHHQSSQVLLHHYFVGSWSHFSDCPLHRGGKAMKWHSQLSHAIKWPHCVHHKPQAVSVDDFFDNMRGKFLESLAFVMGIPLSRFQVRMPGRCSCWGPHDTWMQSTAQQNLAVFAFKPQGRCHGHLTAEKSVVCASIMLALGYTAFRLGVWMQAMLLQHVPCARAS